MNKIEYLLTVLSEECSEVPHRATKAQRFGLEEIQPGQHKTNVERLQEEINDLMGAIEELQAAGVDIVFNVKAIERKKAKIRKFMDYSRECGCLDGS